MHHRRFHQDGGTIISVLRTPTEHLSAAWTAPQQTKNNFVSQKSTKEFVSVHERSCMAGCDSFSANFFVVVVVCFFELNYGTNVFVK